MTPTDEQVTQALTRLADQADGWPVVDRVAGARRRARRTAAVRTGVVAGALAVVLAVGVGVGVRAGLPGLGRRSAPPAATLPTTPSLRIDLGQDRRAERTLPRQQPGTLVVLTVHVHGWVPARTGVHVSPSGRENLLGLTIDWGDGREGSDYETTGCQPGAPLVKVDDGYSIEHYFDTPGRHTIVYQTKACPPVGTVEQRLVVVAQ